MPFLFYTLLFVEYLAPSAVVWLDYFWMQDFNTQNKQINLTKERKKCTPKQDNTTFVHFVPQKII